MFSSSNSFNDSFFNQFRQLHADLEQAFGRTSDVADIRQSARQGFPPVVVDGDAEAVVIKVFAAGFEAGDFSITVEKNLLKIEAQISDDKNNDEEGRYHLRERLSRRVNRVVTLPDDCDVDRISAEYKNGVLKINVGRKAKVSPRVIEVQ